MKKYCIRYGFIAICMGILFGMFTNITYANPWWYDNDLEINAGWLDNYINEGSLLRYQLYYHNNGSDPQNNVEITADIPGDLRFLATDNNKFTTDGGKIYGTSGDVCYVDMLAETGVYMDGLNAFAQSNSMPDLHSLLLVNPETVDFLDPPFNGSTDMVGNYIAFLAGEGGLENLFSNLGISPSDYPECGEINLSHMVRNLGSIDPDLSGYITLYMQVKQNTQSSIVDRGTSNNSQNTINHVSDVDIENGTVYMTMTNNSTNGGVTGFLNKTSGPLLFDTQSMLDAVLTSGMNQKETAIALRQLVKDYTYNFPDPSSQQWYGNLWANNRSDYTDPVSMLNTLYAMCGEINGAFASLAVAAGLQVRYVGLEGHIGVEILIDGQWSWMDADGGVYREDPDDGHIYSVDELAADPDIIINNPQDNGYEAEYYASLISSTGNNNNWTYDFTHDYQSMALHLYPQDTIEYGYLNPFPWRGGDVYGEGIITRQLSTSETITNFLPDGFTWHENIPYLIVDMEIDTDQPLDEDVSVYLTRGNDPEIVLGSLNNRLGYAINTPSRPDNYYGYSLRFECHSMCNTADIIPHISVKSRFIFNTLAIPYNHDIDLHITDADSEFEDITTQWEYNTNNKIYMTSSVNSGGDDIVLNNTKTIGINTLTHHYAILPADSEYLQAVLEANDYVLDDPQALFGTSALLGSRTIDFHNTHTIDTDVILSSEDKKIQAFIPEGTIITPSGNACSQDLMLAPEEAAEELGLNDVDVAFIMGSPCDGTSLALSQPVSIRVHTDTEVGTIVTAKVSNDNITWTEIPARKIDDHTIEIDTTHFSFFQATSKNTASSGGGGSSYVQATDICPTGDKSDSYYDGECAQKHEVADTTGAVLIAQTGQSNTDTKTACNMTPELLQAYDLAFDLGVTSAKDVCQADMYGPVIRKYLAKFLTMYAVKELGLKPDTSRVCEFTDMSNESREMQVFAKTACQLGLMGLQQDGTPDTIFNPNQMVTRAQFGTAFSRLIFKGKFNISMSDSRLWYQVHLQALKKTGIMTMIDEPNIPELRGFVMTMMMKAKNIIKK